MPDRFWSLQESILPQKHWLFCWLSVNWLTRTLEYYDKRFWGNDAVAGCCSGVVEVFRRRGPCFPENYGVVVRGIGISICVRWLIVLRIYVNFGISVVGLICHDLVVWIWFNIFCGDVTKIGGCVEWWLQWGLMANISAYICIYLDVGFGISMVRPCAGVMYLSLLLWSNTWVSR